jgi:DnaJ-class molecular chaperone
MVQKIESDLH